MFILNTLRDSRPLFRVTDLLMQSARCLARASRSSRVVCREPASDREGETFCEFKQTDASNRSSQTAGTVRVCVLGEWGEKEGGPHLAGVFDVDVVDEFAEQPEVFLTACL